MRFSPQEQEAMLKVTRVENERAMAEGTGSAGGFAVPFTLDPTIILTGTGALNPVRDISNVETIITHEWKGVSADSVVATFQAEAAAVTDASPTLVQPDIFTQMARCFIPVSIELFQDWASLRSNIANLVADAKNTLEATKFLLGTGTNEPSGILNIGALNGLTTTQRVLTATVATYAVGDPWLLKAQLPARFIPSSTYAGAPGMWDRTYRFVAQGSTTEPRQFSDGDRGSDFLGRPKVEWSPMVNTTTTGSKLIIAGDFSRGYKIVDRIGMSIEVIPHLFGAAQGNLPTGQRGIFAYWRVGAGVVAPNAFRYMEVA
jgi:HK97 family phage major capsid protein